MKSFTLIIAISLNLFSTNSWGLQSSSSLKPGIEALRAEFERPGNSGSVLLIEDGRIVFSSIKGMAQKESNVPNTIDTRYNIASVGKFLTTLAVFKLASEKGYDIKTKQAQDFFPDQSQLFETSVTLGDLLIHRTGVKSLLRAENAEALMAAAENNRDIFKLAVKVQSGKIKKLRSELRYANSNFFILGEIIERMSGQPYEKYMRDHILIPLGAANAIFAKSSEAGSLKLAQGYVPDNFDLEGNHGNNKEGGPLPENYSKIPHDSLSNMVSSAAGGLYISAKELAQIGVNLYNSEGVSYQTLQAMCTTTIPVPRIIFGYGCNGIEHTPDFIKWGASGGAPGVSAELAFYPQQKAVLVILSNHDMRAKPLLQAFEGPLTPESSGQFIIK